MFVIFLLNIFYQRNRSIVILGVNDTYIAFQGSQQPINIYSISVNRDIYLLVIYQLSVGDVLSLNIPSASNRDIASHVTQKYGTQQMCRCGSINLHHCMIVNTYLGQYRFLIFITTFTEIPHNFFPCFWQLSHLSISSKSPKNTGILMGLLCFLLSLRHPHCLILLVDILLLVRCALN